MLGDKFYLPPALCIAIKCGHAYKVGWRFSLACCSVASHLSPIHPTLLSMPSSGSSLGSLWHKRACPLRFLSAPLCLPRPCPRETQRQGKKTQRKVCWYGKDSIGLLILTDFYEHPSGQLFKFHKIESVWEENETTLLMVMGQNKQ